MKTDKFIFKATAMNLELIDIGNEKIEIRPIHKPKKTKWNKITPFG